MQVISEKLFLSPALSSPCALSLAVYAVIYGLARGVNSHE